MRARIFSVSPLADSIIDRFTVISQGRSVSTYESKKKHLRFNLIGDDARLTVSYHRSEVHGCERTTVGGRKPQGQTWALSDRDQITCIAIIAADEDVAVI